MTKIVSEIYATQYFITNLRPENMLHFIKATFR